MTYDFGSEEWLRRGSSFGAVASAYAAYRPEYPVDAVRWCAAPVGRDFAELRVLDLGAGTGKLTTQLVALGADVTAVEPDDAMRAELRRGHPTVRALAGTAEAIPLPDGSVDAVLCGQSMHWFNRELAVPEIARVLVPGGTLGALWNADDDRAAWVAGLQEVTEGASAPALSRRRRETASFGPEQFGRELFTPTDSAEFGNSMRLTADTLTELIGTHSQVLIMPPPERDRLLAAVRGYLAAQPETSSGEFTLPMVTAVIRSVRR